MTAQDAGLVIVYTGLGKGKTTAALGIVFRALGHGLKVAVVQFIKGKWMTGERRFAEGLPNLEFHVMGRGFTWDSDDLSADRHAAQLAWEKAVTLLQSGDHAVVVLDELSYVLNYGFVPVADVVAALEARPRHVSVVLTGRSMPESIVAVADLVTEMRLERHPFQTGRRAMRGVDY